MMNIHAALGRLTVYICINPYIPEGIKHHLITPFLRIQQWIQPITDE